MAQATASSGKPVPTLANRYRILGRLGIGGMGAVYLATDMVLGTKVAVKENLLSPASSGSALHEHTARPPFSEQFELEARTLAQLRHPHLPRVTDYFTSADGLRQFLVMDYIPGRSLKDEVEARGAMVASDAIRIALVICEVLAFLHKQNPPVFHRDIKPDNIRLTDQGVPYLVDFGITKHGTGHTKSHARAVTDGYSPLEQYGTGTEHTDGRSDIHALGATLFFLLTGTKPPSVAARLVGDCQVDFGDISMSSELRGVVAQAMALRATDRFATVEEFRAALESTVDAQRLASRATAWANSTDRRGPAGTRVNFREIRMATARLSGGPRNSVWAFVCALLVGPTSTISTVHDRSALDMESVGAETLVEVNPESEYDALATLTPQHFAPRDVSRTPVESKSASHEPKPDLASGEKQVTSFSPGNDAHLPAEPLEVVEPLQSPAKKRTNPTSPKRSTSESRGSKGFEDRQVPSSPKPASPPPHERPAAKVSEATTLHVSAAAGSDFPDLASVVSALNTDDRYASVTTVTLGSGTHRVQGPNGIWLGKPIEIIGDGSTILDLSSGQGLILQAPHAVIRGCRIRSTNAVAVEVPSGELLLEDCVIESASQPAVFVYGIGRLRMRRSRVENTAGKGVVVARGGRAQLIDTQILGAESGIEAAHGGLVEMRNTEVRNCRQSGLHVHDSGRAVLERSIVSGNGYSGINVNRGGKIEARQSQILGNAQFGINAGLDSEVVLSNSDLEGNVLGAVNDEGRPLVRAMGTNRGL